MRDPISNLITNIKNGSAAKKDAVTVPHSKFTEAVVAALARKGYVKPGVKKGKKIQKTLEVGLIYTNGKARINDVKRLSKPSKRLYRGYTEIYPVKQGYGSTFVSTPRGVLSDDEVRKEKVGGEILFQIW
ncbi:MAG: 30S ribosomal protein S8 [Patescibacteria group bacterium]|nr:30S ribosomal protein S8 [Patescibacteria group bacterium]MDE2116687.1 30S ribosomal protein S8 [Patescibacteria group bacterium]